MANFEIGVSIDLSDDVNFNRERAEFFMQLEDYGVTSVTLGPTYDINIIEQFVPFAEKTGMINQKLLVLCESGATQLKNPHGLIKNLNKSLAFLCFIF